MLSDCSGRILEKQQDGALVTHTLIVNGNVIGSSDRTSESFSAGFEKIGAAANMASPTSYTVQQGDTLQSIARSVWGDANLWYLIANGNGVGNGPSEGLTAGTVLILPPRVNTVYNNYQTFKPYNAADAIGDVAPTLAEPAAAATTSGGGGCGMVGTILMIVVAVAVTIYTAGALSGASANLFSAGLNALAGGLNAAGASLGFASGAIAGAAGSIATQAVGNISGAQDGFSWKAVALSALGAGVSAGVAGHFVNGSGVLASGPWAAAGRAAIGNAMTQGIAVVTGLQDHFSWEGVAAASAGAGAGVGQAIDGPLQKILGDSFPGRLASAKSMTPAQYEAKYQRSNPFETYELMAEKSGAGRASLNKLVTFGKIAGPAAMLYGGYSAYSAVSNAPTGMKGQVAAQETGGFFGGAVGSTLGTGIGAGAVVVGAGLLGLAAAPAALVIDAGILGGMAPGYGGAESGRWVGGKIYQWFQ
jgi:LysM repeat protein